LTNGLLINPETVKQLKDLSVAGVGVSIDGLDTNNDQIRDNDGLFHRILSGISHVSEANIAIAVITTVNSLNINELKILFRTLVTMGVSRWQVQPIFMLERAQNNPDLCLSEDEYLKFGEFIYEYEQQANDCGMEIRPGDSFGYFNELDTREPPLRGCPTGRLSCGIASDEKKWLPLFTGQYC
jgi:MoaA/NifB/PqqE/SkfB family radical SAM enzyme